MSEVFRKQLSQKQKIFRQLFKQRSVLKLASSDPLRRSKSLVLTYKKHESLLKSFIYLIFGRGDGKAKSGIDLVYKFEALC